MHDVRDALVFYRYVAEGGNCLERFAWILCIMGSFTFAGILLKTNLKDTSEKPVATSVTTIPVQVAVTFLVDEIYLMNKHWLQLFSGP